MQINVNGSKYDLADTTTDLSYEAVAQMAGHQADRVLSIVYRANRKGDEQRSGILAPKEMVKVEDGMRFTVADTSNA